MPRITIIPEDGVVIIDGEGHAVDLSAMPAEIHAVQWQGSAGEIEYRHFPGKNREPNKPITSMAPFQPFIDAWQEAKARDEAAEEEWAEDKVFEEDHPHAYDT